MTNACTQVAERDVRPSREQACEETVFTPPVDILESADAIRVVADLPGVDQKSVEVTIEEGVLTLEGDAQVDVPDGYRLVDQEYGVGRFRRQFAVSDSVDADHVQARTRNGTLEITMPKAEQVRTRKIEIAT